MEEFSSFGCSHCNSSRRRILTLLAAAGMTGLIPVGASNAESVTARYARPKSVRLAIDFHAHMWDQQLLEQNRVRVRPPPQIERRFLEPGAHIEDMDRFGIDMRVVTMSNAIHGISWGDANTDLAIHQRINNNIAENWAHKHPNRFVGSCTLPLQNLSLALPEMDRAYHQLGARVVQIPTVTPDGVYLSDPSVRSFWEAAQELGIVVFIHPHGNNGAPPLDKYLLFSSVGQPIEEAKLMSGMIYEGILEKYPRLKVVVAHGGGFLPHYYGRMDRDIAAIEPGSRTNISRKPSEYLRSFYYDSAVYAPQILDALIRVVGADRIVMGADYPVNPANPISELQQSTLVGSNLSNIAGDTAARLLGL